MKYIFQKEFLAIVFISCLLGAGGCDNNNRGSGTQQKPRNVQRLSEADAIGLVKALLRVESQPSRKNQVKIVTTMCSQQRAAQDSRCRPCAPGSLNYCIKESKTAAASVPGRCRFPPSPKAQWHAKYNSSYKYWQVESYDPMATGRNSWIVNDQSGVVESGYCVFR